MDDEPRDAEQAQWDRARKVRQEREDRERARAEQAEAAVAPALPRSSRRGLVVGLSIALVVALGTAGVLATIRHRSGQEPAWVRQLGLVSPSSASGTAPDRFGDAGTTTGAAGSADAGAIDDTSARRPDIDTTGEDFDHIWRQIELLEDWLLLHPDPRSVGAIYEPGTDASNQLVALLTQLRREHHTLDVQELSRPSGGVVVVRYADIYRNRVELDQQDRVVSAAPSDGRARLWSLTLVRGRDNRWRVRANAFVAYGNVVPTT
jgi:hypothetical protein